MEALRQTPTDSAPFTVSIRGDRTFETVVSLRFIFLVFESSSSPISILDYRVSRQDASLVLTPLWPVSDFAFIAECRRRLKVAVAALGGAVL
jgi:hypothetical protein